MRFSESQLMAAALLFEESHGKSLSEPERNCVEDSGLAGSDPQTVADDIWRARDTIHEEGYRSAAYWALGKLARPSDRNKFVDALREELSGDRIAVAYQVMIALDNLNEDIFFRCGVGVQEEELNRQDAIAFLRKNEKNPN